jgi:hypothetical protein
LADEYDPNHGYNLEDICDRLDNIEAAVKASHQEFYWVGLVILGWLALAGLADMWNSKLRYAWWYNVGYDQVTIQKKPTDCNFFHAPLGDKDCHYESHVGGVQVSVRFGKDCQSPVRIARDPPELPADGILCQT